MKTLTVYKPFDFCDAFDASEHEGLLHPFSDVSRMLDNVLGFAGRSPAGAGYAALPAVNVEERDSSYVLEAELPGFTMDDISVNLDGGAITIESKKDDKSEKDSGPQKTYVLRERHCRSFSRSFKLPENADPDAINAAFKNGLLTLTIGKRAEAQKKTIQIEG
jgi:HSP20 family protein